MKKMIIFLFVAALSVVSVPAFAQRGCGGGGCRPCPPPPPPPCRPYYGWGCCGGNNGVRLATDIVSLVGASVCTLKAINTPPVAVVQPAAVVQPVVTTPPAAVYPAYYNRYGYNNGYVPMCPVY